MNRRKFITTNAIAGTGLLVASPLTSLFAFNGSPNEKVIMGIIGTNGRGSSLISMFEHVPNVEIGYICDVDENVLNRTIADVEKKTGRKPKGYKDLRKLL